MFFQSIDGSPRIEELSVAFDPTAAADKVARRRRMIRSRLISLGITVVIMVAIYFWQRDQMSGAGFVTLYAVVLGISVAWVVVYLVGYLLAKRQLAEVGTGIALRIGRPGVEMRGVFVPWPQVSALAATRPKLGHPAALQLTPAGGQPITVPLDQLAVRPATLDLTARAYSAGRHGVDLSALDS
jgi:hypothetical protein